MGEDELKRHSDFHGDLHEALEAKRAEHAAHDLALRHAKHALGTMKGEPGHNPFQRGPNDAGDEAPLQRLAHDNLEKIHATGGGPGRHLVLRRSPPEVWRRTPHAAPTSGPPVLRAPAASSEWMERAEEAFRNLLVQRKGVLYRDDRVAIELNTFGLPLGSSHRPVINFEFTVANQGGHSVHDVKLIHQKAAASAGSFELRVQPQSEQDAAGQLARRPLKYWGELEITGPYEIWPQVIFSYLLADNQSCKALLRLPLAVTRLLSPAKMDRERFLQLWESHELAHHEVAFVCHVRENLVHLGATFSLAKCLEFGGSMHCIPGLDETPGSAVLAALSPIGHGDEEPAEVLVRAELAAPTGHIRLPGVTARSGGGATHAQQCRVAIRSASHTISRALGKVMLEVLSDSKSTA